MRRIKTIQVDGRGEVTVREVSVKAVYQALSTDKDRLEQLKALVDDAVTPGFDEIIDWWMSEVEQVLAAFLEINSAFFGIARTLKVDGLVADLVEKLKKQLPELFARSLSAGISMHGNTGGRSS